MIERNPRPRNASGAATKGEGHRTNRQQLRKPKLSTVLKLVYTYFGVCTSVYGNQGAMECFKIRWQVGNGCQKKGGTSKAASSVETGRGKDGM